MPPHQPNLTFETGRDEFIAVHREVSTPAVKDAVQAAPPDTSIAAPDGALPRPEAAGRSTLRIVSFLKRCWRAFEERRERQRLRTSLHYLSDRELSDIGITRGEIDHIASKSGFDPRGGSTTTLLWITSRGVA